MGRSTFALLPPPKYEYTIDNMIECMTIHFDLAISDQVYIRPLNNMLEHDQDSNFRASNLAR